MQSDTGFSVEILGRTGIEYREPGKVMFVDSEVLQKGIAVFKNTITRWNPPHEAEVITEDKRREIIQHIRDAVSFLDDFVEVI